MGSGFLIFFSHQNCRRCGFGGDNNGNLLWTGALSGVGELGIDTVLPCVVFLFFVCCHTTRFSLTLEDPCIAIIGNQVGGLQTLRWPAAFFICGAFLAYKMLRFIPFVDRCV